MHVKTLIANYCLIIKKKKNNSLKELSQACHYSQKFYLLLLIQTINEQVTSNHHRQSISTEIIWQSKLKKGRRQCKLTFTSEEYKTVWQLTCKHCFELCPNNPQQKQGFCRFSIVQFAAIWPSSPQLKQVSQLFPPGSKYLTPRLSENPKTNQVNPVLLCIRN